jgi:hypothetical protein
MESRMTQVLGWIGRVVLALLAMALLLMGLLALADMLDNTGMRQIPTAAGRSWLVLVAILLALLVLVLAWRVVRFVVLAPLGSWQVFGSSTVARLLGLAVAGLLLPQAVYALVNAPIVLLIELGRSLPNSLRNIVTAPIGNESGDSVPIESVLMRLLDLLQLVSVELTRALDRALQPMPVVDVVLAIALWALAGHALSGIATRSAAGTQPRILAAYAALRDEQRYLLGLCTVFLIGGFLSIASIVAIPWLKDDKAPVGLGVDNLQKALEGLAAQPADLQNLLPTEFGQRTSPFAPLDSLLATSAGAAASAPTVEQAGQIVKANMDARTRALQRAAELREGVRPQQDRSIQAALRAFEAESSQPMSSQERLFFFREIQRQVGSALAAQLQALVECRRAVESIEREAEFASRSVASTLQLSVETPGVRVWDRLGALSSLANGYDRACARGPAISAEFVPPEPGAGWGPFGKVANWLLRTKSFALALITGMLGFGLLGAAISAFVRTDTRADNRAVPRANGAEVGRVVVRGLSAAVVLFLAVKGGLAILAVGEQDPNAYVLFFTCLVGAVFSEDVWTWARTKFLKNLGGDGKLTNPAGGAGVAAAAEVDALASGAQPAPAQAQAPTPPASG